MPPAIDHPLRLDGLEPRLARRRRHVRRRGLLGRRRASEARRLRRRRHHAAALRPRRRHRPQGRLLRRPGHPRCPPRRRAARHPALRARLRGALPRGGDRRLRRQLSAPARRRSPASRCNQRIKFGDLLDDRRAISAPTRSPPATTSAARWAQTGRSCYRAADAERDQSYFLFATTREQLELPALPAGRPAKSGGARACPRLGLPVADKPDSQDICFVPNGPLHRRRRAPAPGGSRAGRDRPRRRPRARPPRGHAHFTVGQRKGLRLAGGEPLYVVRLDAARRQSWSVPRARSPQRGSSCAR